MAKADKVKLVFDVSLLENGLYNQANRSGIYFVALNVLKELSLRKDVELTLHCPNYIPIYLALKKEFPNHNFNILCKESFIVFKFMYFYNTIRLKKKFYKESKQTAKLYLLQFFRAFLSPIYKIIKKIREIREIRERFDAYLSPYNAVSKSITIPSFTILYDLCPQIVSKTISNYQQNNVSFYKVLSSLNKDAYYFAISNATRNDFLKHYPIIDKNKIITTPLACDKSFTKKTSEEIKTARLKYKIPQDKKYIFSLCTLEPRKNLIRAIKCFLAFIKQHNINDLIFVLGGGHWDEFMSHFESEFSETEFQSKVIKIGYVDDEDLPSLYSGSLWFVYTSMYEGFGLPPLEAMSCGCPVITSNNSSLPEVVGEAGIMIDYDSDEQHIRAYESYYFDEKLRQENSKKGLERAGQFSWEKCVNAMVDFIKENIKQKDVSLTHNKPCLEIYNKNLYKKFFKPKNKKILLINHTNFLKNNAGNNIYLFNIVKILKSKGYSIDFLSSTKFIPNDYEGFEKLNKECKFVDNIYLSHHTQTTQPSKYPYSIQSWVDDDLLDLFLRVISQNDYSYIFSNYINFSDLFRFSDLPDDVKIVNIFHDFHTMQYFLQNNDFDKISQCFDEEVKLLQYYDDFLCISYDEKYLFEKFYPNKRFYWLPFFASKKPISTSQKKDVDCLFVGFSNIYNYNGVVWFYENVYRHLKGVRVCICGKVCAMLKAENSRLYQKMLDDDIQLFDFVDDLSTMYERTKIVIAPILNGTGLKVKVVEAMSYSLPVVATTRALDGFMDKGENGCMISDEPLVFANNIKKLLSDEKFYSQVSSKISKYFESHFLEENAQKILEEVLNG